MVLTNKSSRKRTIKHLALDCSHSSSLDFDRLRELQNLSNGAALIVCGGGSLYFSNKAVVIQNNFTVSELK